MAMMIAGLRALLVALVLGGLGGPVLAQSLPGLPGEKAATTGGEEDALARAIRQAAESGVIPPPRLLYTRDELREVTKLQAIAHAERNELETGE